MGAGKVDYDNLWKNAQYRLKRIRWRLLKCVANGAEIRMFGYSCHKLEGPWFGFPAGSLVDAVCTHCGKLGAFANEDDWYHICPARHNGKRMPCEDEHACRGEPSMANAPMWRSDEWIEVET